MSTTFPVPTRQPGAVYEFIHAHVWFEVGAKRSPIGVWFSVWACELCPDIGTGGPVGPVPMGYCSCGWVQAKWPRKKCENCKRPVQS